MSKTLVKTINWRNGFLVVVAPFCEAVVYLETSGVMMISFIFAFLLDLPATMLSFGVLFSSCCLFIALAAFFTACRGQESHDSTGGNSHHLATLSDFISRIVLYMFRSSRSCILSAPPHCVRTYQLESSPPGCSGATFFHFVCLKMSMLLLTGAS